MAYIQKCIGRDGTSFSYKVTIKHRSRYLKSKTFKTKRLAKIWAKKIEDDLALMEAHANEGAFSPSHSLQKSSSINTKGKTNPVYLLAFAGGPINLATTNWQMSVTH